MTKSRNISAHSHLTVRLLGSPQLFLNERPVESLRRKNRALLYYVAAHDRPVKRESILALFWPDHVRTAAQQTLRTMLHDLRTQLGSALALDDEALALAPEARVDLHQFEEQLAVATIDAATLASALDLYRGEFLEGFSLADTPTFDDWVVSERERLRLLFLRALMKLGHLYETQHDWREALEALERALALDPLQEELQRAALRVQYLKGDRPGAIRRFEAYRKLLDDEMGVPPMPETRALYDAIITDTLAPEANSIPVAAHAAAPRSAATTPLPFVGRTREMQELTQTAPTGKLILIQGEPGIGKTRLAQEFIGNHPHALVLTGRAYELEQGLPYQPIVEALRRLASSPEWDLMRAQLELAPVWQDELARLVPDLFPERTPAGSGSEESRMWEALYRFIVGLAQPRPVIFFLDDLHWADTSTLGWLGYLLRRPIPPHLVSIATARSTEAQGKLPILLQTLARQDCLARVSLGSLHPADLHILAEQLAPAQLESFSGWLARTSEGNPFYVTEMVRYTTTHTWQDHQPVNDPMGLSLADVPESIHNLITARLAPVSDPARRVLDAAAIIGREFESGLVMRVSGLGEDAVLDSLDELRAAALIQSRERGRFAFDHHLTMEVVLQEMSKSRQLALHRHIAQALEVGHHKPLDPIAGLIASHWALAESPGHVAPYAFRAGQFAASVAAWTEAIAFYEQALATETNIAQRIEILIALGTAHFDRGDAAQGSTALRSAIALAQERQDWPRLERAHLEFNLTLYAQGQYVQAIAAAQELRRSCPPDLVMAAEFNWGMALSLQSTHPVEAESHLREAERLMAAPRRFPSRLTPATLIYQLGGAVAQQGRIQEAIALYRQAMELVTRDENALDLQRRILLHNSLAYYLYLEGDAAAAEHARAGLKLARDHGSLTHQPYLLSTSGEIALGQNDLDAAQELFAEGLRLAEELAIPERITGLTANLGLVAIRRGNIELARRQLTDALARADRLSASHLATRIRIWLAPLLPSDEARQCLSEARAIAEASGYARLVKEIAQLEQAMTA